MVVWFFLLSTSVSNLGTLCFLLSSLLFEPFFPLTSLFSYLMNPTYLTSLQYNAPSQPQSSSKLFCDGWSRSSVKLQIFMKGYIHISTKYKIVINHLVLHDVFFYYQFIIPNGMMDLILERVSFPWTLFLVLLPFPCFHVYFLFFH